MELRDVEICLGIQFPELFHTINNSGMIRFRYGVHLYGLFF